jgi:hypothetical protein
MGTPSDQHKGMGDDLKTSLIPFRKSEYQAQEYLFIRIPVRDEHFSFFDFTTPILNIKGKSIQGVASYVTSIPYPIPETFVERQVGLSYRLLPHRLIVEQKNKPKHVIKKNMITTRSVNAINTDKQLCNYLEGNYSCKVDAGSFSKKIYKIKINILEYPPGMFTLIPYHGHTIMIAKEAGTWGSVADKPGYAFGERYNAFSGVAKKIASAPEVREPIGKFYMDSTLDILLPPMLEYIKGQSQKSEDGQEIWG